MYATHAFPEELVEAIGVDGATAISRHVVGQKGVILEVRPEGVAHAVEYHPGSNLVTVAFPEIAQRPADKAMRGHAYGSLGAMIQEEDVHDDADLSSGFIGAQLSNETPEPPSVTILLPIGKEVEILIS
jgi:hypothetical protein